MEKPEEITPQEAGVENPDQRDREKETRIPVEEEKDTPKNQEGEEPQTPAEDKQYKSLNAQKEHFRTKTEKLEQQNQELQEKLSQAGTSMPSDPVEVAKLANKFKDYSAEEVDFIRRNAKSNNPEDLTKAADDEFVQAGINSRRQKVEQDNNLAEPSSPSANFSKDKTPEEIAKMSRDEHERYERELRRREQGGSGF